MPVIKIIATETNCNTVANAYGTSVSTNAVHQVRVVNIGLTPTVLTLAVNSSVNVGTYTLLGNSEVIIEKPVTYLLSSNLAVVNVFCSPVSYRG